MTVTVTLTANQTSIPSSSYITGYEMNGSTHYYMFVDNEISWENAYQVAKSYSFCGMRGYLATITSAAEDAILDAISMKRGWAGAARISTAWTDAELDQNCNGSVYSPYTGTKTAYRTSTIWKWTCGPEAGQSIDIYRSTDYYYGVQNGTGYSNWNRSGSSEPNGSASYSQPEMFLEVHFPPNYLWNDIPANWTSGGRGYFVEFSPYSNGYVSGYSADKNVAASQSVHGLVKTAAVAPTCTEKGNNEYYTCSGCGKGIQGCRRDKSDHRRG